MSEGAGRRAVDEALKARYPRGEAGHVWKGGRRSRRDSRVYLHPATGKDPEHWHYVTLGLSELDEKTSTNQEESGWGLELTMRVEAPNGEIDLPEWPVNTLARLAAYVDDTGRVLRDGDKVSLEGAVDEAAPSIKGLAMQRDPELGTIDTPNGRLTFLQTVGVMADEADLITRWSGKRLLDALAKQTPLLLTRPERTSLLRDPMIGPMLEEQALSEGSNEGVVMVNTLVWKISGWSRKTVRVSIGPADISRANFPPLLASRTSRGRDLRIVSGGRTLKIRPGETADWQVEDGSLVLTMSPALVAELDAFLRTDQPSLQSQTLPGFELALVE